MEKINVRVALAVFERIRTEGEKIDDYHLLGGIKARSDFDGYTVMLEDNKVSMNIFFHNRFNVEYDKKADLDEFVLKMERLYQP